jgi:cysteine desulfuration protein SufE
MSTIREEQNFFISEFNDINDWLFQYECLLEMSTGMDKINENEKTENNLVSGCQSKVWLICELRNGRIFIRADSEALIIKGIVGVIVELFSGRTPQEIIEAEIDFIEKTTIKQQISTDRFQGMKSVIERIKQFAVEEKDVL